jgi:transposase-like protein
MVKQLKKDLSDVPAFFSLHPTLWRQLKTTNIIERVFVEVRRRTRPMVCCVNVDSVDRIIYFIFQRIQSQMAGPQPPSFDTSCLTSSRWDIAVDFKTAV